MKIKMNTFTDENNAFKKDDIFSNCQKLSTIIQPVALVPSENLFYSNLPKIINNNIIDHNKLNNEIKINPDFTFFPINSSNQHKLVQKLEINDQNDNNNTQKIFHKYVQTDADSLKKQSIYFNYIIYFNKLICKKSRKKVM